MKMKSILTFGLSLLTTTAFATAPIKTFVPVDYLYAPEGFDSNDNAEVVVSGILPNLCYKSPMATYKIVGRSVKISVKALYSEGDNGCAEMAVPFTETVHLGVLDKGLYNIEVDQGVLPSTQADLKIAESSSNAIDDAIYANVGYVDKEESSRVVKLKGYTPSDCMELDEVKIISNGKDTLSVLPKMKKVYSHCPMKMIPFTYEVEIPKTLAKDVILLHVRSMGGKAVNSLFPNYLR